MEFLREYRKLFLSGAAVLLFLGAAYFWVSHAEEKDSAYAYAEKLFQEGMVNEINIEMDEADWQDILENPLAEEYHRADVTINGETIGNVAIRTKGNNTLTSVASSDSDRYSFKIDFDYYDENGNYYGLKKLCLNNNYGDSSYMREYISYHILEEMGISTPGCGYSHITVNGEEWGLYLAVEAIDEVFLATHFENAAGDLYKPDGTGADLVYRGDDLSTYTGLNLKTNEATSDGSEILALMQALESGEGLEEVLDVDEALRYLAVNVALANFDSYLGSTTHNYYLYEQNGVFSILPWDYNYSFGGFGGGEVDIYDPVSNSMDGGRGPEERGDGTAEGDAEHPAEEPERSGKGETPAEENTESPMKGKTATEETEVSSGDRRKNQVEQSFARLDGMGGGMGGSGEKPLVTTLLENEEYLARYEVYLQEIAELYFTEEYMTVLIQQIHDLIAPYVEQDATAFYTYEEFEQASSTDPADAYSLVYYAVNMAESILNQLNGGEPTFNSSSLKGGGMGGGMGGGPSLGQPSEVSAEQPEEPGVQSDQSAGERESPDQMQGGMPAFAEQGGRGDGGFPGGPMGMGERQADRSEYLFQLALCGGIFLAGLVFALLFQRKKKLKMPEKK